MLQQERKGHGLHQVAAAAQRHGLVGIDDGGPVVRREALTRQRGHRLEQAGVKDAIGTELPVNHVAAGQNEIGWHD